jgi:hypothetical protein
MSRSLAIAFAAAATITMPLAAQHEMQEHRPPAEAPRSPDRRERPDAEPELDQSPHVYDGRWFGHASPGDERFRLDRPFEHGIFGQAGPSHHFPVARIDRDARRLWLPGGFGFEVAAWDWPYAADWCWTCGEDFIVYDDPDHSGWYLLYDIPTGQYVHVQYLGM